MNIDPGTLHWPAVVVPAVAAYALGAGYYAALAHPWMAAAGLTREAIDARRAENNRAYGTVALSSLVGAVLLAIVVQASGAANAAEGLLVGLIVGIVVTAVGQVPNYAFQYRGMRLYLIDAGYPVLQMLAGGAILGGWR